MPYGFAIEILSNDGRPIELVAITPDWQAAVDWTHFDGVRVGVLPGSTRTDPGTVEPIWDDRLGEPYVTAFRVTVHSGGGTIVRTIPRGYLQRLAAEVASDVARRHQVAAGTDLRWVVRAAPAPAPLVAPSDDWCAVEAAPRPWPITDTPLAPFLAAATRVGTADAGALPVFISATVIAESHARAHAAGDVEIGGALLGRLHRDVGGRRELFLEITAALPAPHTVAGATTITFTAETWGAVHTAAVARGRNEVVLGWMHSHLDWCRLRQCPEERRRTCTGAHPFLSAEDLHLHATIFPAGYQVALLISDSAATGGLTTSLYGWSEGAIVPRAFHLLTRDIHGEPHA